MSIAARLQHKLRTDLRKEHDTAITGSVLNTQQRRTSPPRGREKGVRHERAHREQFNLQTLLKPAKLTCGDNSPGCRGPGRARGFRGEHAGQLAGRPPVTHTCFYLRATLHDTPFTPNMKHILEFFESYIPEQ